MTDETDCDRAIDTLGQLAEELDQGEARLDKIKTNMKWRTASSKFDDSELRGKALFVEVTYE